MDKHYPHISNERWPLHFALAWILTRDSTITHRSKEKDYYPSHPREGEISSDRPTEAWRLLYGKLCSGEIPAWTHPYKSLADPKVNRIEPGEIVGKHWINAKDGPPFLREQRMEGNTKVIGKRLEPVYVSSKGIMHFFAAGDPSVEICSDQLGAPYSMEGPGYIGLTEAAYWVASEQGKKRIILSLPDTWKTTLEAMLAHVASGNIKVICRDNGRGSPVQIDGIAFSGIAIDYPYADASIELLLGNLPYLSCTVALQDNEDWVGGYNDKLFATGRNSRHQPTYSHIQVLKADVLKHFAPTTATTVESAPRKKGGGKEARIVAVLQDRFRGSKVPEPSLAPRSVLKSEIEAADKTLGTISALTMRNAIDAYNAKAK